MFIYKKNHQGYNADPARNKIPVINTVVSESTRYSDPSLKNKTVLKMPFGINTELSWIRPRHFPSLYRLDNKCVDFSAMQKNLNSRTSIMPLDIATERDYSKISGLLHPRVITPPHQVSMTFDFWIKNFINMLNDKVSNFCQDSKNYLNKDLPQTKFEIYNSFVDNNLRMSNIISDTYTANQQIFNNAVVEFVAFQIDIMDEAYIDSLTKKILAVLHSAKLHDLQTQTKLYHITYYFRIETNNGFWRKLFNPRFRCVCRLCFSLATNAHPIMLTDYGNQHLVEIQTIRRRFTKTYKAVITQIPSPVYNPTLPLHIIL